MKDNEISEENVERKQDSNFKPLKKGASAHSVEDEAFKKAFGEQDREEEEELTAKDVVQAVNEIYGEYRKTYKSASKQDKVKILLIILPLAISLIIGVAGITVANIGQMLGLGNIELAGVILIAIGFGGFFMTIVLIAIIYRTKGSK